MGLNTAKDGYVLVPGRGEQRISDIEKRIELAGMEIQKILEKYDVNLHGIIQFITPEVQIVPAVSEDSVVAPILPTNAVKKIEAKE